jgi:hypothetical protein
LYVRRLNAPSADLVRRVRRHLLCLLAAALPAVGPAAEPSAEDNPLGMSYVRTPDLELVWFEPLGYLAPHATRTFTNSLKWQQRMFGWTPSERTAVLLKDTADYGHAAAMAMPRNRLMFDVAPLSHAFETYPASERLYSLMNHELVHVVQGDLANDEDRSFRRLFSGKVTPQVEHPESLLYSYLTVPRFNVPRWYLEGTAVFAETWMGGGLGRAQGGYDEMVFRTMVRDGAPFYDPFGLESRGVRADFQAGANAYLYGTRFMTYLALVHSPEKVIEWIRRDDGSERDYAAQFRKVFGVSLDKAWEDWIAYERAFQQANLAEIRKHPVTPHRKLVDRPLGSMSRVHYDEAAGQLYAGFRMPGVADHIGAISTRDGSTRRLADIRQAMLYRVTSFAFDPATGTAFYTNDNLGLRDLMAVDVRTGASRTLLVDARIGDFAFNPADRALIGVRHAAGFAVLVRVPFPYDTWQALHVFPYGVVPYDLDVSPDGGLLSASVAEVNGDQFLRVWDLAQAVAGNLVVRSEFRFGQSVPESFVFSRDGRYLYGSSYYTGVSNIFRYTVATGEVEAVSNTDSDFFRPFPLVDGRLLVLTYTAAGFVPAVIDPVPVKDASAIRFLGTEVTERHPVVTQWQVDPPSAIDDAKLVEAGGAYRPLSRLSLVNAYPVLQGYRDFVGAGVRLNFADPLEFATLGVTAAVTPYGNLPGNEWAHLMVEGRYLQWWGSLWWNRSDFYDIFGPTQRSFKGFAAKGGYEEFLIFDGPRRLEWFADAAYYDRIDTLPGAQNVATGFDHMVEGSLGLRYSDVRRSRAAAEDDSGMKWTVLGGFNRPPDDTVLTARGTFDVGTPLPGGQSLWLRTAAGAIDGPRSVASAYSYFGAFGNNYVDGHAVRRYRDWDTFPGFAIDGIRAQAFVRAQAEWNAGALAIDGIGTPALYPLRLQPALFATVMMADPTNATYRQRYANVGAQLDLNVSVLHWYGMTLSVGYALGFGEGRRAGGEWMMSLKVL